MVQPRSVTNRNASEQAKDDDDPSVASSSPESDDEPQVKKRRRVGTRRAVAKKRKTSTYRGLDQLCIDELYIIFADVYPMDLLNLARTCKYLRGVLMHKSSQFLWKTVLGRVKGLPICPDDLTEPQYTNLVFYTRCHGCDKPATGVLWRLRRRYCSACKQERLIYYFHCESVVLQFALYDKVTVGKNGQGKYVDKDQYDLLVGEYHSSTDKEQFQQEKLQRFRSINVHASQCGDWQRRHGRVKRFDLDILRRERCTSIFERLKQHGYGPEIAHFSPTTIQASYKMAFKQHAHLTDSGWEQMWPKWVDIMNSFRLRRLDATCYQTRRKLLVSEYGKYVRIQTPGTSTFDLLPHVAELAAFPPFRNVIEAPEETQMGEEPFASAFAQLPVFLGEWKQQLDIELMALVEIPTHLNLQDSSSGHVTESNSATSNPKDLAKPRLACALFTCWGRDLFNHRDVLLLALRHQTYPLSCEYGCEQAITGNGSTQGQPNILFLKEAPYIVHACGLDPNVATADDMDHRNARLRCLVCAASYMTVMNWRDAMLHASDNHINKTLAPLSEAPRWQLISDDYIDAIQAVEEPPDKRTRQHWMRCLLCRPRIGNAMREYSTHLQLSHGLNATDIKEGVHYECLGFDGHFGPDRVEMAEEGGQVIFRESPSYSYRFTRSLAGSG